MLCNLFCVIEAVESTVLFLNQVRPPGHHAGIKQAMGFCLHNNAAVAALAAQVAGAKKVLIVDWVMFGSLLTLFPLIIFHAFD